MMDNNQFMPPPPVPQQPYYPRKKKLMSYGLKLFLIGLIACLLMIGTLIIYLTADIRSCTDLNVSHTLIEQWGQGIDFQGPYLDNGLKKSTNIEPQLYNCDAELATISIHRGIYDVEVYTAKIAISGTFLRTALTQLGDSAIIKFQLETKQISNCKYITFGGKRYDFQINDEFLYAKVSLADMPEEIPFSTNIEMHGSQRFYVWEVGDEAHIKVHGDASNPSFKGHALPESRSINRNSFIAEWRNSRQSGFLISGPAPRTVGVDLLTGLTNYQKVERSLKYSFIIILLTFLSVLFIEMMRKQHIPLFNYFLIGVALIIFYSLLLSFSELIAFGWAYLIAAGMTVLLISGYIWRMLRSHKLGLSIGCMLSMMYLFCYIMLITSTYALLLGSLVMFITVAALMYASVHDK
jgi:inner membrane protein